ncbi:hypothetical protein PMIT1320_00114 [Prochlorococcus marinus str. MIT 1320]|nr:hypothetical protein PMIT1320_00114 [Prochlorococcus marinus str. MIT 1320]
MSCLPASIGIVVVIPLQRTFGCLSTSPRAAKLFIRAAHLIFLVEIGLVSECWKEISKHHIKTMDWFSSPSNEYDWMKY